MNRWQTLTRSTLPLSLDQWAEYFQYGGLHYPLLGNQTLGGKEERIDSSFEGYVRSAYQSNGIVFACMLARLLLFSEARFQFRRRRSGRPGELFGGEALRALEKPYRGGTTGNLLTRALQDVDLAGNWYGCRRRGGIRRMRPDWVTIVMGVEGKPDLTAEDLDAEVLGYLYHPGGWRSQQDPVPLLHDEVAHFAPIPDPLASYRGMSWLTPVLREIMGDGAASAHKLQFFENGATPNLVVTLQPDIGLEKFERWIEIFDSKSKGLKHAYETMYLGAGAQAEVVGANMRQIDFKQTQGAGETRIAAAAGVPPVIVGLSEGLAAATYSNYGQARRRFADGTMRPLWRDMAGSLETIIPTPSDAELWYDDRDIPFLQEDVKDAAEIAKEQAITIRELINAGYEPDTVTDAVISGDFSRLKHSGLISVQLQPPGTQDAEPPVDPPVDPEAPE